LPSRVLSACSFGFARRNNPPGTTRPMIGPRTTDDRRGILTLTLRLEFEAEER
jgi:hypothetical protein